MLTIEQTTRAINAGLGNSEPNIMLMLAAIEGAIMGQCYLKGIKVDDRFIAINAIAVLTEGVERQQRAKRLGL